MNSGKTAAASVGAAAVLGLPAVAAGIGSANAEAPRTPEPAKRFARLPSYADLQARVSYWRGKARANWRRALSLRYTLLHRASVAEAINLAGATYGQTTTLWRKARCESKLNRWAHNPSGAAGLFQFLPSTWNSTPFAGFSVYSPEANALAAGWMHAHGRGGEWVCQ